MKDPIEKQDIINAINQFVFQLDAIDPHFLEGLETAIKIIEKFPSEWKRGKWIDDNDTIIHGHCSCCGFQAIFYETDIFGYDYCPNCGARLEEKE